MALSVGAALASITVVTPGKARSRENTHDLEHAMTKALVASRLFDEVTGIQIGPLQLVRYLGRGAVGVVYEALDPERGPVAVKLLGQAGPRGVYRVKREFRSIADLQHPNLVTLHELFHERGQWFFSMELVDGLPFDRWARPHGARLDGERLRDALRQLMSAVSAIHAAGKLHSDLKPSNVLVSREGVVKVLDFGLVSDLGASKLASDTGLAGTPEYIAPEQAAGLAACPASDWYAVGVMLYRVLAGRPPFEGEPFRVLHAKQAHAAPVIEVPSDAQPELYTLCERLLLRDPLERAGADDVLAALDRRPRSTPDAPARRTAPPPTAPPPLFVGREAELEVMHAALQSAASGTFSLLLLGGPSGIGKSALLDRFAEQLGSDVLVLRGRCYEQESLPYKVFDAVVDALSRHLRTWTPDQTQLIAPRHVAALVRLFPVLGRVEALAAVGSRLRPDEPGGLRDQAFEAAKELFLRLTDHKTVVIMVDDLQWGDLDSARMMAHVFGLPEPPPLLFLGAYRGDESRGNAFVSALQDERGNSDPWRLQRLTLEALPMHAAAQLASQLLESDVIEAKDAEQTALAVAHEARGVPFFINELAEHVRARRAKKEPYRVLASLEHAVLERIHALAGPCQELLDVLAVAAQPIEPKVALSAAAMPNGERSFLHALRVARLVRGNGAPPNDEIEIYHDRIRHMLSSRITPERSRALHARIAKAMEEHGVRDPDRLVGHYIGADDRARAAQAALSAARAASSKLAFNRAAELYGRVLELLPAGDARLEPLRVSLADALANAGRGARASEQYLLAAENAEPVLARELQLKAAQQCLKSGLTLRGIELAEPLLRGHGVSLEGGRTRLIARLLFERARGELVFGSRSMQLDGNAAERLAILGGLFQELMVSDPLRGAILHAAFQRHAMQQPDPVPRLKAQVWACVQAAVLGGKRNERKAAEIFRNVSQLRREIETPYAQAMEHLAAAALHQHAARFAVGLEHGRKARQLFDECPGTYWERAHCWLVQFSCSEFVGDLREVTISAPELARAAAEREDDGTLMQVTFSLALARLAHDEPVAVLAFLEKRIELLGSPFTILHYLAGHRIADCLLYLGRGEEALRYVNERWSRTTDMHYYRSTFIKAVTFSLRARVALSAFAQTRSRALLQLIRGDLNRLDRLQHGYGGLSLALRGTLLHLEGDHAGAIASLEAGVEQLEAEGIERFLHPARRRLGAIAGGDRGAELIARADSALHQQDVRRPARFTAVMMGDIGEA